MRLKHKKCEENYTNTLYNEIPLNQSHKGKNFQSSHRKKGILCTDKQKKGRQQISHWKNSKSRATFLKM